MTGRLVVVGLGPGNQAQITPEALAAVEASDDFFGYFPYIERLSLRPDQRCHASDNREEISRAEQALRLAVSGGKVCVVSGGDPGVFAMAAAVCEAIESGPAEWRDIDFSVVPGVTAMLAVAARAGAPLGHDFCAISLSDNLKPWGIIEKRLIAAAEAGFVMAFYNPVSRARPHQLGTAFDLLRAHLPGSVPVIFGRAAGRTDERIRVVPLSEASSDMADMATCIIVGSVETRLIERSGKEPLVYSPRFSRRES
ncbi:precorrin-3B C(17)-methyltransferase [Agrobacterium sp. B1(2019)]|uniref:precorrin-3B C(17)-methyltransferase n=1 Tax=Agrobacterium sp. B1(2019) TaxID=2607032 RepID=UPI0011EC509F|nr:precorrin-3B C(17)-methyltransferase [Agrobacterium sp. B1(2019)]TZG38478.1 precorrin-3B C(17)-methyltransferase [Agrobacterium sp. B1(2019)]